MKKINNKGTDSGTQFSHWTKNPHVDDKEEKFESKESAQKINDEQVKRVVKSKKIKLSGGIVNVYKAEFSEIDQLLDDIRKECRKNGLNDYACTNIRNLLDDTLKKVKQSQN
jgi:hypothetical protein|tara:strand:+ start:921 stop:1256 length:336 start_codon:yes stop_codon:yes gene_type:complete